jgi:hypothetical protein
MVLGVLLICVQTLVFVGVDVPLIYSLALLSLGERHDHVHVPTHGVEVELALVSVQEKDHILVIPVPHDNARVASRALDKIEHSRCVFEPPDIVRTF